MYQHVKTQKQFSATMVFETQDILMHVTGANNENISVLEYLFSSELFVHGNIITIRSNSQNKVDNTKKFVQMLINAIKDAYRIDKEYIQSLFQAMFSDRKEVDTQAQYFSETKMPSTEKQSSNNQVAYKTENHAQLAHNFPIIDIPIVHNASRSSHEKKRTIVPRTKNQALAIESFHMFHLTFLVGPAGTGKTLLTTAYALSQLMEKHIQHYIVTRPVVEVGEKLGYLPGDLYQKILPYMRPVLDELHSLSSESTVEMLQEKGYLEIAPLAYMRGRTLKQCIILFDEAQNSTPMQMRMFLTRLGEGAKAIVTGDISQSDIQGRNGLVEAIQVFQHTKGVNIVKLEQEDIQRSHIAKIVINAYNQYDVKNKSTIKNGKGI